MSENPVEPTPTERAPLTARLREAVLNSINYKDGLRTLRIYLDVSENTLSNFLKDKCLPNSETTLRLLEWIKLAQVGSLPIYPKGYSISEKQRASHQLAELRKAKRLKKFPAKKEKVKAKKKPQARRPRKKPTLLPTPTEIIVDRDRARKIIEALEAQTQRNRFQDRFKRLGLAA